MTDEEIRTRLRRTPANIPVFEPDAERVCVLARRWRRRRRVLGSVAAAVLFVAVASPLWLLLGLRGSERSPEGAGTGAGTSPRTTENRCVRAEATGDFDGDGETDMARFVEIASSGVSCDRRGAVIENLTSQELAIRFASGQALDVPFTDCQPCLTGGEVFTATDLDGDGRDEFAIDVGPGAAIDDVAFYRVDPERIRPLEVAEPGDPPSVEPGPAVLGGGFDSALQSPIVCRVNADGTRELVSIHAENVGGPIAEPWRVHRTTMVLEGDRLIVTSTSDARETISMTSEVFRNDCP
jgi:hypothetical protein